MFPRCHRHLVFADGRAGATPTEATGAGAASAEARPVEASQHAEAPNGAAAAAAAAAGEHAAGEHAAGGRAAAGDRVRPNGATPVPPSHLAAAQRRRHEAELEGIEAQLREAESEAARGRVRGGYGAGYGGGYGVGYWVGYGVGYRVGGRGLPVSWGRAPRGLFRPTPSGGRPPRVLTRGCRPNAPEKQE